MFSIRHFPIVSEVLLPVLFHTVVVPAALLIACSIGFMLLMVPGMHAILGTIAGACAIRWIVQAVNRSEDPRCDRTESAGQGQRSP